MMEVLAYRLWKRTPAKMYASGSMSGLMYGVGQTILVLLGSTIMMTRGGGTQELLCAAAGLDCQVDWVLSAEHCPAQP